MSIIDKALSALGLMRVAEHERLTRLKTAALDTISQSYVGELRASTDLEVKYKAAIKDLAVARDEVVALKADREELRDELSSQDDRICNMEAEIASLRPDAQKWRDYLKRSRDRKRASAAK